MEHKYFGELLQRYPSLKCNREQILSAFTMLKACYSRHGTIFIAGNGGSRADAEHISGELMKGFLKQRPISEEVREKLSRTPEGKELSALLQEGIKAIPLGWLSLSSAINNDTGSSMEYAQPLYVLGRSGDVLIGISTSGNAKNIINAVITAKALDIHIISMTGETGGELRSLSDVCIAVPESEVFKIQELHLPIYHAICAQLEEDLFD